MPAGTNTLSGWTFNWEGEMYEFGNITYIGIVRIFVGNVANLSSLCPFSLTMNQTFSKDFIFL